MNKISATTKICNAFRQGIDSSKIDRIEISKSAVDDELFKSCDFGPGQFYPEGKIFGIRIKVIPDVNIIYKEK